MDLQVTLSKKSWHYRLQKRVWGRHTPYLNSLCPYFWFTMLTLVVTPFWFILSILDKAFDATVLLIYFLLKPFNWVKCKVTDWFHYVLTERTLDWIGRTDPMDVLVQIGWHESWRKVKNNQPKLFSFYLDKYEVYDLLIKVHGHDMMFELAYHVGRTEIWRRKFDALEKYAVKEWNPTWWKPFIKWVKYGFGAVVIAGGAISMLFCAFLIYVMLSGLGETGFTVIYFLLFGSLGAWGILILFREYVWKNINWFKAEVAVTEKVEKTYKGTSLAWNMVLASFKKVCPSIDWKEEIENNTKQ